jgi:hypothetical protein
MSDEEDTLLEFPCDFPIKAFGHDTGDFGALVRDLVREHAPEVTDAAVRTRASRGGRYLAVTVTVRARSRAQLDRIYHALTAEERVLFAL